MDAKTYEYMKERTKKFEELVSEQKELKEILKMINQRSATNIIGGRSWIRSLPAKSIAPINAAVITAMNYRLEEIEKEMEEI